MLSSEVSFGILESCWVMQLGDQREETSVWLVERDMVYTLADNSSRSFHISVHLVGRDTSSFALYYLFQMFVYQKVEIVFPTGAGGTPCLPSSMITSPSVVKVEWVYLFSSVTLSCLTLCNPMDCSTTGLPVHHQLPVQIHDHWVSDTIQPSHPLLSPSSPAFNLSQQQGLFQWVSSLH